MISACRIAALTPGASPSSTRLSDPLPPPPPPPARYRSASASSDSSGSGSGSRSAAAPALVPTALICSRSMAVTASASPSIASSMSSSSSRSRPTCSTTQPTHIRVRPSTRIRNADQGTTRAVGTHLLRKREQISWGGLRLRLRLRLRRCRRCRRRVGRRGCRQDVPCQGTGAYPRRVRIGNRDADDIIVRVRRRSHVHDRAAACRWRQGGGAPTLVHTGHGDQWVEPVQRKFDRSPRRVLFTPALTALRGGVAQPPLGGANPATEHQAFARRAEHHLLSRVDHRRRLSQPDPAPPELRIRTER